MEVQWASLTAIAAIERAGGRIRTAYYDLESLKAAENPEAWFRAGKPIPRRMHPPHSLYAYYSDPDYRGFAFFNFLGGRRGILEGGCWYSD